jgi:DNA-binding CsgD family transcriptional regulator
MKIVNPCLDRLISAEVLAQALALMRPRELAVAALRVDGLTDVQIGELLGIGPTAVNNRIVRARARILDALPELRVCLDGRQSPHLRGEPQLSGVRAVFTPVALAEKLGVSPVTVRRWCHEGRLSGAWRTANGRWHIPAEALPDLQPPAPCTKDR